MIEIIVFVVFLLVAAGDCYSTAKLLRFNHKLVTDKNFKRRVNYKMAKKLREDNSRAEMSAVGRKVIQKLGGDRAMLYIFLLGYGPLSLIVFYLLLNDFSLMNIASTTFLLGFMIGALWRQIMKAITLKQQFGVEV